MFKNDMGFKKYKYIYYLITSCRLIRQIQYDGLAEVGHSHLKLKGSKSENNKR